MIDFRRFINGFNNIVATLTDLGKGKTFRRSDEVTTTFDQIKQKLTYASVLVLPGWTKLFEVIIDANKTSIGAAFNQNAHPSQFFSEKFRQTQANYSAYDADFYAVVHALRH